MQPIHVRIWLYPRIYEGGTQWVYSDGLILILQEQIKKILQEQRKNIIIILTVYQRESVLFIGTQFSNLYTSVYLPTRGISNVACASMQTLLNIKCRMREHSCIFVIILQKCTIIGYQKIGYIILTRHSSYSMFVTI